MSEPLPVFTIIKSGQSIELTLEDDELQTRPKYQVLEDEQIEFQLFSKLHLSSPTLWIQDVPLYPTTSDGHLFFWRTSSDHPLFRNHFGYCELRLVINEETYLYSAIEVLAKKINADRTQDILRYLENQINGITNFCFSLTHQKSDSDLMGIASPQQIMQEIKLGVNAFIELIPQFLSRRRSRLITTPKIVDWSETTTISECSIDYVLTHPDLFIPATSPTQSIKYNNQHFSTQTIKTELIQQSADVYENRVIIGYFETCYRKIIQIQQYYDDFKATLEKQAEPTSIPFGYQSIHTIRKHFGTLFCDKILNECKDLLKQLVYIQEFIRKNFSVTRPIYGMPQVTSGFLSFSHYRKIFERIVSFYRLGKLNTAGSQFLYNLRTLDKLYEFFCLYRLLESFEKIGFKIQPSEKVKPTEQHAIFQDVRPADSYALISNRSIKINIHYDKEISSSLSNNLIVKQRGKTIRRPDFVIEFSDGATDAYLIFDAKYTSIELARNKYLPELTMKYFHGLGTGNEEFSRCMGIFALHPRSFKNSGDESYWFHKDSFNLYSASPAFPALGTLTLEPESPHEILTDMLSQFIKILRKHF